MWRSLKIRAPPQSRFLTVGYVNTRGQEAFSQMKILQLTDFIKQYKLDIINIQETNLSNDTFADSAFISRNFNLIYNNVMNKYGTAVLISTDIQYSNVKMDSKGRVIVYDLDELEITGANIYMQCGSTAENKNCCEEYSSKILPELLLERKNCNFIGGDWNSIVLRLDCT